MADEQRFAALVDVAMAEPPRVRAMLGAIGEELAMPPRLLDRLKGSLNPSTSSSTPTASIRARARTSSTRFSRAWPKTLPSTRRLQGVATRDRRSAAWGETSGDFPTEVVPISSLVAQYLVAQGPSDFGAVEDLAGFDMSLLHFRRTFVEKMFALHGKVVRLVDEGHPLGRVVHVYMDVDDDRVWDALGHLDDLREFAAAVERLEDWAAAAGRRRFRSRTTANAVGSTVGYRFGT